MTSKRTVVVAVAVAVGVVASLLSYVFLNNAQQNAYHNAKLVPAYVITKPIPRLLTGSEAVSGGYIVQKKVPAEFRPSTAVTNVAVIRDQAAGANLPTGEVVVSGMFQSPDAIASVASETVPQGDVAISVSVDQVHGVAGLIQPGDKVDILVDLNGNQETYLFQSVPVLAVGTTLVPAPGTAAATATQTATATQQSNVITFAVTPAAAARIALGQQQRRWRDRRHLPGARGRRQPARGGLHHQRLEPHPRQPDQRHGHRFHCQLHHPNAVGIEGHHHPDYRARQSEERETQ